MFAAYRIVRSRPSTDQFVSSARLDEINPAMVHKRPPAAGAFTAATASGKSCAWQTSIDRLRKSSAFASSRSRRRSTLLDGGATVPFVARYRKEVTGALDDAQLRTLEERLNYLRELEERRTAILNSVREQGKLDAALEAAILAADSKGRLEDIYLPFKPKRRTKAEIAKEAGLEPLAELLLTQPQNDPQVVAATVRRCRKAGGGCRRRARRRARHSGRTLRRGRRSDRRAARADVVERPDDLHACARARRPRARSSRTISTSASRCTKLPSHRILALFRGEKEEILDLQMLPEPDRRRRRPRPSSYELKIMQRFAISDQGRPGDRWLVETARWAWRTKIQVHLNIDLRMRLWNAAETGGACACSPRICATCCWRRRPARASPWGSIPASAPASRSRSSMPPARWWRPRRSIRTSRSGAGTRRWRRWASSRSRTAST